MAQRPVWAPDFHGNLCSIALLFDLNHDFIESFCDDLTGGLLLPPIPSFEIVAEDFTGWLPKYVSQADFYVCQGRCRRLMQKVIVADDQEMYRAGVIELLSRNDEFRLAAQLSNLELLLVALAGNRGALVIMSTSLLTDLDELVSEARKANCRVLLVAEDSDSPHRYCSSGVAGIIQRSTPPVTLVQTMRRIQASGETLLVPAEQPASEDAVGVQAADRLNLREMVVLAHLMQGLKNRRIAERLGISEHSVRTRIQKIFDKTGQSSRLELALFVSRHRAFATVVSTIYLRIGKTQPAFADTVIRG